MASKNQHGGAWLLARQCFVSDWERGVREALPQGRRRDRRPSAVRRSTLDARSERPLSRRDLSSPIGPLQSGVKPPPASVSGARGGVNCRVSVHARWLSNAVRSAAKAQLISVSLDLNQWFDCMLGVYFSDVFVPSPRRSMNRRFNLE